VIGVGRAVVAPAVTLDPLRLRSYHALIQTPLTGLIRNVDTDFRRYVDNVGRTNDLNELRRVTLLLMMLRFAINSYQAAGFLLSDVDEHPKRLPQFVLVMPPINRQIMDLWFSLVYIMDNFAPRALAYDQCGYRETIEEVEKKKVLYGTDPEWQGWFQDMGNLISVMEAQMPLTPEQKADPSTIPYWLAPFNLAKQPSQSQGFLQFLERLLYHDTSAEAHLKPGGLFVSGSILLRDIAPKELKQLVENRTMHQYKFKQFCRTVLVLLGVISEIELYAKLGNREQLVKVWGLLAGYNADAKDVYQMRYQVLLN
jgi:hypothetical protein